MQSKTSCFNGAVCRKTLSRCWPLWAAFALILLFWLPVSMANQQMNGGFGTVPSEVFYNLPLYAAVSLPLLTCLFGLVTAGATFDFLFSKRATGMMASLPLRRESVFCSNLLAGAVMLLSSGLLAAVLAAIYSLANGQSDLTAVLTWLGVYAAESMTFYGIGVFCAMLTGQILVLPCLYLLVNFGGVLLSSLLQSMARLLLIGVPADRTLNAFGWLDTLSPCSQLLMETNVAGMMPTLHFIGWTTVLVYLAVGLALLVFSLLLFRRRGMEFAQEPVTAKWLGQALKYIVTFFCALGFPTALALFFGSGWVTSSVGLVVLIVLGAAIGYLISEMILHKSVRVMKKSWHGLLITAAVVLVIIGAMKLDVFGYVHHVPDPDEIESAEILAWSNLKAEYSDPDDLAALTALHRDLIDVQEPDIYYGSRDLELTYHLKNGRTLTRWYYVPDDGSDDSPGVQLRGLLDHSDRLFNAQHDLYHDFSQAELQFAEIDWSTPSEDDAADADYYTGMYYSDELSKDLARDLMVNGILPDLEAGAFPHLGDEAEASFPSAPMITVMLYWQDEGSQELMYVLNADCTNTLAWMTAHGYKIPGIE